MKHNYCHGCLCEDCCKYERELSKSIEVDNARLSLADHARLTKKVMAFEGGQVVPFRMDKTG